MARDAQKAGAVLRPAGAKTHGKQEKNLKKALAIGKAVLYNILALRKAATF